MDDYTAKRPIQRSGVGFRLNPESPEVTPQLALDWERLRFERQKYALEVRLKRRAVQEQNYKYVWKDLLANPVTIAIVGGVITLVTAVVTNYFNASETRRADAAKAQLLQESTKETLQADLIKKFVESPRTETVRQNLRFLVDAGLIPSYAESIKKYLDSNPGVAPQVGGGIEFLPSGVSVADDVKERLQKTVRRFTIYLQNLGLPDLDQNVSVFVYAKDKHPPNIPGEVVNAFVMDKTIFIHESLAVDVSIALREYAHHALFLALGSLSNTHQNEIESALADYLPASFLGSPIIGAGLGSLFGLSTTFVRTLDSAALYERSSPDPIRRGAVWASALWACRERVGQQAVDDLIIPTWRHVMGVPNEDDRVVEEFGKALRAAAEPVGFCFSTELKNRKLP